MTHYKMLDRVPSVVVTTNHNELKLYQGNIVYLNDGDNFELRFFNPLQEKIGVEIIFNGIRKGDGYLVLNPGQDLTLDRFLDEQRKMLFETYHINGNDEEAVEAIAKNGIISFNFYKEYHNHGKKDVNVDYNFPPTPVKRDYPIWYASTGNYSTLNNMNGMGATLTSSGMQGAAGPAGISGTQGSLKRSKNMKSAFQTITSTNNNSRTYDSNVFMSQTIAESFNNIDYLDYLSDSLETGRIEKGEISNQRLKNINMNFVSTAFHTIEYKLMPYSTMNRTIGEVRQYCTCCGYRLRNDKWSYCPKCGEKII